MALPITVPYTFGNATTAIPLSNLDSDYATVYQAVNGIGNGSVALANVTITGGTVSNVSGVVPTPFTANGVVYASSTSALATGGGLVFDGSNLGIGVTPSSWGSIFKVVQGAGFGGCIAFQTSGASTKVGNNWYYDGTNYVYTTTNASSRYDLGLGQHLWYTAPSGTAGNAITFTQAMTLESSGTLLVGTTTSGGWNSNAKFESKTVAAGSAISAYFAANTGGQAILCRVDGTTPSLVNFFSSTTNVGSITTNGTITVYNTTSDYRLKTVVGAVSGSGERIDALQPVEYTWNSDGSRTRGFLAHQFQEVYAGSVTGTKDAVDAEGKPVYQSMQASTSEVIADLVAEIQSLRKRILTLENK